MIKKNVWKCLYFLSCWLISDINTNLEKIQVDFIWGDTNGIFLRKFAKIDIF